MFSNAFALNTLCPLAAIIIGLPSVLIICVLLDSTVLDIDSAVCNRPIALKNWFSVGAMSKPSLIHLAYSGEVNTSLSGLASLPSIDTKGLVTSSIDCVKPFFAEPTLNSSLP